MVLGFGRGALRLTGVMFTAWCCSAIALPQDVSGTWEVIFKGSVRTKLVLHQQGSAVTGVLTTTDNSRGEVKGTFAGGRLRLERDTGLKTVQRYEVDVAGDEFRGHFRNVGAYPDDGTFTGRRVASGSPGSALVDGVWVVYFKERDRTTLTLKQNGDTVTGTLVTTDRSRGEVRGTVKRNVLTLMRDTGLATIQHYQVTIEGDRFTGRFRNEGRWPDEGSFTGRRE
ncbi:MAG: hypothetical protein J0L64_03190 [Acidobacteria bacterium]|nr:hypothetical protein [Acidobacteriota bacterium]